MSLPCPKCSSFKPPRIYKDGRQKCLKCGHVVLEHKCKWRRASHSLSTLFFMCSFPGCFKQMTKETTPEEKKLIKAMFNKNDDIHRVWHNFQKHFIDRPEGEPKSFKWKGYELSQKIERWAQKYPEDVHICAIDDSHFMSSDLVLIEHKSKKSWMGVSAVLVCQNNDPVVQFFLYPGHVENVMKALAKVTVKAKKLEKMWEAHIRKMRKKNSFY
jgi:hypothetical protein